MHVNKKIKKNKKVVPFCPPKCVLENRDTKKGGVKMKKIIAAILMSIVMLSGVCGLYASAYESNTYVTPRLNNTILTNVTFEVCSIPKAYLFIFR